MGLPSASQPTRRINPLENLHPVYSIYLYIPPQYISAGYFSFPSRPSLVRRYHLARNQICGDENASGDMAAHGERNVFHAELKEKIVLVRRCGYISDKISNTLWGLNIWMHLNTGRLVTSNLPTGPASRVPLGSIST